MMPTTPVHETNGSKEETNHPSFQRKNPRFLGCVLAFLLAVVLILPLEILEIVQKNQSFWIQLYGSKDVGGANWCEAIDADLTQFIIEPWNSRSAYAFVIWGCLLVGLGFWDYLRPPQEPSSNPSNEPEAPLSSQEASELLPTSSFKDERDEEEGRPEPTSSVFLRVPNPILRYPHITMINGIFNALHGLGSFWNHACECSSGGKADVAGMLSVTVFPLFYTPLQLLLVTSPKPLSHRFLDPSLWLSCLPPIGQTTFFVLVWYGILPYDLTFTIVMALDVLMLPLVLVYLYCWRNQQATTREEENITTTPTTIGQRHRLFWWLYPVGLALFGFGFWAWNLDVDGVWCHQKGILKVLQGHAVWHLLTSLALVCVYMIYRSEQLTLVTTTTTSALEDIDVDDGAGNEPQVKVA